MSKETDLALKNLIVEILENISTEDILANANIKPTAGARRSASSSINKVKKIMGVLTSEAEAISAGGTPYRNTFIKNLRTVSDVRVHGRSSKDGIPTPESEWGGFELLSYFFELYYKRTAHEFPLECPAVTYEQYVKAKNKWVQQVTRGLSVMSRLIKILDGPEQVKNYIDWWFATSFTGKTVSWGWLSSASMIAMFQARVAASTVMKTPAVISDSPLPADFVEFADSVDDIHKFVGALKTHKQLKYLYNAWKERLDDDSHPVVIVLKEAINRSLIQVGS